MTTFAYLWKTSRAYAAAQAPTQSTIAKHNPVIRGHTSYAGRRIEALPTIAQSQGAAHENAGRMLPARDEAFPDIENEYPSGEQEEGSPDGYWPDQPRLRLR